MTFEKFKYRQNYAKHSYNYDNLKILIDCIKDCLLPEINRLSGDKIKFSLIRKETNHRGEIKSINIIFNCKRKPEYYYDSDYNIRISITDKEIIPFFNGCNTNNYGLNNLLINYFEYLNFELKINDWSKKEYRIVYQGSDNFEYDVNLYKYNESKDKESNNYY